MPRRTSVFFTDRSLEVLGENESLSGRLNQIIDRYDQLISYARRDALEHLTPEERKALKQAMKKINTANCTALEIAEAIATQVQDAEHEGKLPAGAEALPAKLRAMDVAKRLALAEWIERG